MSRTESQAAASYSRTVPREGGVCKNWKLFLLIPYKNFDREGYHNLMFPVSSEIQSGRGRLATRSTAGRATQPQAGNVAKGLRITQFFAALNFVVSPLERIP